MLLPAVLVGQSHADVLYTGTNLAGAEFGDGNLPGVFNTDYTYPTAMEVDYYLGKGMNFLRIPFRWERLQQTPFAALDTAELSRLSSIVGYATSQGATVLLDPHNGARYYGQLLGTQVSNAAFDDFWSRLASQFEDDERVVFGLMNEPNTMPTEQWFESAQGAIHAIRSTGAQNLILVPGNGWTGAHSWLRDWYGTPNAEVMIDITDPLDNFAFEVHQYLDPDSSGTSSDIVSESIGQERLVEFTDWLRANDRKGFLGEFAVANSTIGAGIGDEAITNMLGYIDSNDDVWLGWTWWAGGPWWGDDIFTIEPTDLGLPTETDRPVMGVVEPFLAGGLSATNYCSAFANSSGNAAEISAWGSNHTMDETLALMSMGLPAGVAGIFYYGTGQRSLPFGDGLRCVGGTLQRLPLNQANTSGVMIQPDVFSLSLNSVPLVPGTFYFQAWYRDPGAMASGFNLSDGLQITFVP